MIWQPYDERVPVHFLTDECRVVLVLGAGASGHLEYPLGGTLCDQIVVNTTNPEAESFRLLVAMGFEAPIVVAFNQNLRQSLSRSIDEFLADRPEFIDVGRAAIAQVLIERENEELLLTREKNWYGLLRDRIRADIDRNVFPPVIVTFNYDLSLDKSLYNFLSSSISRFRNMSTLEGVVRVLHVHGRLGHLDFETALPQRREYGKTTLPNEILEASRGIRIISELDSNYGRDMVWAQRAIEDAERVIFLGFGYDEVNLDRLRITNWKIGKFHGTAFGLDQGSLFKLLARTNKKLTLGKSDCPIYDYLQRKPGCWTY